MAEPMIFTEEEAASLLTSQLYTEDQRCTISDFPLDWCACWKCQPELPFADNTEEN